VSKRLIYQPLLYIPLLGALNANAQTTDTLAIFFNHDSSVPNKESVESLNKLKKLDSSSNLIVQGYTDTTGSVDYNEQLSLDRINNVLKTIPVANSQIEITVGGETSVFGTNEQNRRVVVISEIEIADTLVLGLQFVNRQAVIREKSYPELIRLIDTITSGAYSKIELHGHVCCNGNYQLSLDRAKTVERELIKAGVKQGAITCYGHSNKEPRYPETNSDNEAKNRRVEVVLIE